MSKNKKEFEMKTFKIITLGDSGVGKTSILKRFVSNTFELSIISTIGFETSTKEIILKNGNIIRLQLIDTAGQENYQALTNTYIRNADGALFIFSHDSKQSFNNIKRWLNSFKDNNQNIDLDKEFPGFLVGNKCDLEHVIDNNEIKSLKNENNFFGYADTSTKEDIGINYLFYEIGEMFNKIKDKTIIKVNMYYF